MLQIFVQSEALQVELDLIQFVEGVAKVDQQQGAFVAEQREERGLAIGSAFHGGQHLRGFACDLATVLLRKSAPCTAPDAHHLVKRGEAFERERDGGELSSSNWDGRGMRWIHRVVIFPASYFNLIERLDHLDVQRLNH